MKDPKILAEIPPLLKSRQYYVAAFRRIEATINRDVPVALDEIRKDVGKILKEAIAQDVWPEANKILKNLKRFLTVADYDDAQLLINEITIPESFEELDESALLL